MNKNIFLLLLIALINLSCSVKQKPEFLRIENIEIKDTSAKTITLKADAFFNNPNDVGGTLSSDGIVIFINDVELGKVTSEAFKVPANKVFSIPLEVTVYTKDVLKNDKNGIIGGILNSILNKTLKVQYKGDIIYKALGISYRYPIDITEDVNIKL